MHPRATGVKPSGQEHLWPTFTRPGGQPQAEPAPRVTWFPGHRGARLELGVTVPGEAAGGKNGDFFRKGLIDESEEGEEVKPTGGGRVSPARSSQIGCDVHGHLRLKAETKGLNSSHPTHPTHTWG